MDALTPERRMQIEGRQVSSSQVMPIFGTYYVKDTADLLAEVDRLRADNDSLKVDAVNWGAWRERVAAEFFQSDRFGMNDIWIAITALILQRDEAQRLHQKQFDDSMIAHRFFERFVGEIARGKDFSVKVQLADGVVAARDARSERAEKQRDEARSECALVEKERDEAIQSFRTAIELEGPQKYATLLDERDALAGKLEAMERERDEARRECSAVIQKALDFAAERNATIRELSAKTATTESWTPDYRKAF